MASTGDNSTPTSTDSSSDGQELHRDMSVYLDQLDHEFTELVLPAIVYLAVLMVIGILGNSLVLYVYTYKTRTGTITRYIQALAVFDLLSCCLAMPGEIADMSQNYTFGRNPVCKIVRTVNLFCTMASGVTLVVVAIDRYKRICSPLKDQISLRGAYIIVVVCACVCGVLSLPSAAIFGSRTIPTRWSFINGTDCSISDQFIDTAVPLVYNGFQMLLFIVGAVIITVLYFFIGRTIFRQAHLRKVRTKRRNSVIIPIDGKISPLPVSDPSTHSSQDASSPETAGGHKNVFINSNTHNKHGATPLPTPTHRFKKLHHSKRQNGNFRNSSGSKFVDIELSSTTTVSPPETPIDQQYFDYKPLIKTTQSKQPTTRTQTQKQKQKNGSSAGVPKDTSCQCLDKLNNAQTTNEAGKSQHGTARSNHEQEEDSIISGNLTGFQKPASIVEEAIEKSSSPQNCVSTEMSSIQTVQSDVLSPKPAVGSDCNNCKNKDLERLKVALGHPDGDSGYGDTESQEKMRWSVTMMTSQSAAAAASFPDRRQVLFRSNSDVGCRPKGCNKYRKEAGKRAVTSDDEGDSRRRKIVKKRGASNGAMRRHSSFKRFRDLKKLSISSDPQGTRRTTLMLFLISLIYVLSFLPHLLLMTIKATHPTSLSGEGGFVEVAHNILLRSYFINSVANPIIYSFCSRDFLSRCLG